MSGLLSGSLRLIRRLEGLLPAGLLDHLLRHVTGSHLRSVAALRHLLRRTWLTIALRGALLRKSLLRIALGWIAVRRGSLLGGVL